MLASGNSSLSIWTPFNSICTATVRTIAARCLIAWTRQQTVQNFAIIGTSKIGGTDIVQGVGDNVLNDADLYSYFDETDRIMRIEYERNLIEPLGGSAIAMATIVLDNNDLRFTPDYNATIGTALKPNRPIKLFIGFKVDGQEVTIPIIEALSLQPQEDKLKRTVTIQANDFITFMDNLPQETSIYTDERTDQIIADILARAGIGSSNYTLDEGLNTPGFVGFDPTVDFAGQSIQKLCEAEQGIFYQDELGTYKFENRMKSREYPYTEVQWTIEADDILDWQILQSSQIINYVVVNGKPRSVKGEVEIWRDGTEEEIVPGGTLVVTAQFNDPVTSITAPEALVDYQALDHPNGAGSDITSDVVVTVEAFTNTAQITITNNNMTNVAHMWYLKLRGTPATVDYTISETYENVESVGTYNQKQQTISNDYIQSSNFAAALAKDTATRYGDPNDMLQLKIRGVPQLQLRDLIRVQDPDLLIYRRYRLVGIQGVYEPGSFIQTLTLREVTASEAATEVFTDQTHFVQDNWNSGKISTARWNNWGGVQAVVLNKQFQITSTTGGGYYGIDTKVNGNIYFDLTGSYVENQVVNAGNQSLASWVAQPIMITKYVNGANNNLYFAITTNYLQAWKVVGGVYTLVAQKTYDATDHQYLKIMEVDGTIYWKYSANGLKWSILASAKNPFDITKVNIGVQAGSTAEASTTTLITDNFNLLP